MQAVPASFLAFIFCGQSEKNPTTLKFENEKKDVNVMINGRSGRTPINTLRGGNIKIEK